MTLEQTKSASETPPPPPSLDVRDHVTGVQEEAATAVGESRDEIQEHVKSGDPDRIGFVVDRLTQSWIGLTDRVVGVLRTFGFETNAEEVEASQQTVEDREQYDTRESPPADWKLPETVQRSSLTFKDWKRAEHAKKKLEEHKEWNDYISQSIERHSRTFGFSLPKSTVVTFMEMESGFNPMAHNKSGASGLSQVMPSTWAKYLRSRKEVPNSSNDSRFDPKTGIDVVVWCLSSMIQSVNYLVDKNGFPQEYKLAPNGDVKYLYMTYNNGPWGYLVLRRYLESKTERNKKSLVWFQKRLGKRGGLEGEDRAAYASRVAAVAQAIEATL